MNEIFHLTEIRSYVILARVLATKVRRCKCGLTCNIDFDVESDVVAAPVDTKLKSLDGKSLLKSRQSCQTFQSIDKLELTGRMLGRVFNSRRCRMYGAYQMAKLRVENSAQTTFR